ncbi:uncharacterized protein LOC132268990 [Cornus florida]|uniref:uncharacterized protein LOC132268990 n=1 Tax=Cornus florida TaxID=4283 RepID=UPI002899F68B|nr:uncharacterized protein LOC132268990 [Cornus florida]XP_059625939.1 uncharacterized protein LOC132268990 [Cornus florida]
MDTQPTDLNDYSPSSTIVNFDCPVPLLRGPLAAGSPDDPSTGPFVLAFKNAQSWFSAYKACESQITTQCEAGARIGCAISASSKCKPPWWKTVLGRSKMDFMERAKCEEREMAICVQASKEKCREFAKEKCLPAFRDARIAFSDRKVDWKEASKLIYSASLSSSMLHTSLGFDSIGLDQLGSWIESKCVFEVTNCRGSDLLGTNLSDK